MNDTMHLFAGAGGGLLADLILGHRPIIAVELDKYACSVLRARAADGWFPDLSVWEGDVRMFDPSEYAGKVGCIHAGFPCQDISVAGKQAGVGEETRSGLYREVLRIADVVGEWNDELELFLENVSAIISNGLGTVLADLAARGYSCRWICLRASDVGANHGRDRWWLLARKLGNAEHNGQTTAEVNRGPTQGNDSNKAGAGQAEQSARSSEQSEKLANSNKPQCQGAKFTKRSEQKYPITSSLGWWEVEPDVGRVVNELANRTHRLKAIGNGQVPLQAAVAYSILEQLFKDNQ